MSRPATLMARRRRLIAAVAGALLTLLAAMPGRSVAAFAPHANAFTYAGEYRDPASGATYLRARWYHPSLPAFISRDPLRMEINHYAYGGANPVSHVDPSGLSYHSFGHGLGVGLGWLNHGVGGHFARLFLGQFLVPLQIVAAPGAFWRSAKHDTAGIDLFLSAGVAVEVAAYAGFYNSAARLLVESSGRRFFAGRTAAETALGSGQALVSSFSDHMRRFHTGALLQGVESIAGPELVYRLAAGVGYQPFTLTRQDIATLQAGAELRSSEALVLRMRIAPEYHNVDPHLVGSWTTPWQEVAGMGTYHESLIAVTGGPVYQTEIGPAGVAHTKVPGSVGASFANDGPYSRLVAYPSGYADATFEYVGRLRSFDQSAFNANPRNIATTVGRRISNADREAPHWWSNNCHAHVKAVVRSLGLR